MSPYHDMIETLLDRRDLTRPQAARAMSEMLEGLWDPPRIAAFLTALAMKGETAAELSGLAEVMRRHMIPVDAPADTVDTCGTGGSGLSTVNTSTLCAFVLAAAGVPVAKHGNRASSGKCGSMDVLEHLGVNIELSPTQAQAVLEEAGLVFLYARRHHPALGQVTPVRRSLGFRTTFNFLGPICNPARVRRQMMGVSDPDVAPLLLRSLEALGAERAIVAWGEDGLDEITLTTATRLWTLDGGEIRDGSVAPEDFGFTRVAFDAIAGGEIVENAGHMEAILQGRSTEARLAHTAVNAGAGLWVAGAVGTMEEGVERARALLASGAPYEAFERYRSASRAVAP